MLRAELRSYHVGFLQAGTEFCRFSPNDFRDNPKRVFRAVLRSITGRHTLRLQRYIYIYVYTTTVLNQSQQRKKLEKAGETQQQKHKYYTSIGVYTVFVLSTLIAIRSRKCCIGLFTLVTTSEGLDYRSNALPKK